MSLFQCSECGCMENTALSNWAWRRFEEKLPDLCSACDPEIKKWHGKFERIFLPTGKFRMADDGNLEHIETGDKNIRKYQIKHE